ncbi:hypothetical protein MMC20_006599 [Loxospora ochrophaea]|nr:hypothetical protein [Loxospora ochrophaea]
MEDAANDDRPIAVRRKRRTTVSSLSNPQSSTKSLQIPETRSLPFDHVNDDTETPKKTKKRVRFSDPGPELLEMTAGSTGLTPHFKRTKLTSTPRSTSPSTPRLLARTPRRRFSLPANLPTSKAVPSSSPLSGEVQFAPLREVLDDRVQRRLRRNNLSEEINEIDADKKSDNKRRQEIRNLKSELALAKKLPTKVVADAQNESDNVKKVCELEEEISRLKEEMRQRSATAESEIRSGTSIEHADGDFSIYDEGIEDNDLLMINADRDCDVQENHEGTAEIATQTAVDSPEMAKLQETLREQTSHLLTARLELEYLFPGENVLGLSPSNGDVKPILDALIDRLRTSKAQIIVSECTLKASQNQENNLRNQFNAVLQQLERARNYGDESIAKTKALTSKCEQDGRKIQTLQAQMEEKERSIQKLQNALESYRSEVSTLEALVTKMETDHAEALGNMKEQMDEAVADLECHVAAETRGRREAETEADERLQRVRQLELSEKELKGAVNDKQNVIRELEREMQQDGQAKEMEVGGLNVRIGEVASNLEVARLEVGKLEAERVWLIGRVREEKEAGVKAVENMKAEMDRSLERLELMREVHVRDAQSRGAEVAEHKGLLTPVTAVRFKDAESCESEGHVEITRGKGKRRRRLDSGVCIMEEDEDE